MLLEHPRATNLVDRSVLVTLFYCCMYHWESNFSNKNSPMSIKKTFNLSDKQFLWTALQGRARVKHWPLPVDFDNLFSTKVSKTIFTSL